MAVAVCCAENLKRNCVSRYESHSVSNIFVRQKSIFGGVSPGVASLTGEDITTDMNDEPCLLYSPLILADSGFHPSEVSRIAL